MKFLSLYYIPFFVLLATGCQKKEVFQPVHQSTTDYMKDSREYSKSREESERKYLQTWVTKQQDSLNRTFEPTSSGIWIRFIKNQNLVKAKNLDWVSYTAEVKTLDNETIYSFAEFGNKQGILSKFKEIRGIENALHLMGKGDVSELLIPSFSGYGLYGDENKIGANVPLVVELHVTDVKPASEKNTNY